MSNEIIDVGGDYADLPGQMVNSGHTMQRVGNQFATAIGVQKPRNLNAVKLRVIQEAELSGEAMFYSWAVRNKDGTQGAVEGPSIKLAMAVARNFGNCAAGCMEEVEELPGAWIFTGSFIDLETGFNFIRKYRQSKSSNVHMKTDDERKADIRFQIGQSKAIRNAVIAAVPESIVAQAIVAAKRGVLDRINRAIKANGIAKVQDAAVKRLTELGASEAGILLRFGIADRKALTSENLVCMHGDIRAIQDGEVRALEVYPEPDDATGEGNAKLKDAIKTPKAMEKPPETKPAEEKQEEKKEEKAPAKKRTKKEEAKEPAQENPDAEPPPADEVVDDQGEVRDANGAPDWFEKRKVTFNIHTNIDRMRLPIMELVKEWGKANDKDKVWWEQLVTDATIHLASLCNKVSQCPLASKLLSESLKGYDSDETTALVMLIADKQKSLAAN